MNINYNKIIMRLVELYDRNGNYGSGIFLSDMNDKIFEQFLNQHMIIKANSIYRNVKRACKYKIRFSKLLNIEDCSKIKWDDRHKYIIVIWNKKKADFEIITDKKNIEELKENLLIRKIANI